MIISASRRTDIPAFYSDWLKNRIKEGFVCVRNPLNPKQISRISLHPNAVDGIVLWTKDPAPIIDCIEILKPFPYYFQFTLNPYGRDIEPGLPSKEKLTDVFKRLSDIVGPERVLWRYDPIIISSKYTVNYHIEHFYYLSGILSGYTDVCTFSFLDIYRNTLSHMKMIEPDIITPQVMNKLASAFSVIAKGRRIRLQTCAEDIDLEKYGISHGRCIDDRLFERITGDKYRYRKDANQRSACGCMESVDIGAYDCCLNGCKYCYATHFLNLPAKNHSLHDPMSPLLIGSITETDRVTDKKNKSSIITQLKMDI